VATLDARSEIAYVAGMELCVFIQYGFSNAKTDIGLSDLYTRYGHR
jgi:hypothetical protein